MTLFLRTPRRRFEIDDAYVMVLSFLLFYAVGKIVKEVLKRQKQKQNTPKNIANPRGGAIQLTDDSDLALTILSCISDNERYLVKNERLKRVIFELVKEKIKNESLIITPNLMRFLALKLLKTNDNSITKIGNLIVSSNNRGRLYTRIAGSAVFGLVGAVFSVVSHAIALGVFYYFLTQDCGYRCDNYFENIPKQDGEIRIYGERREGNLVIAGNDEAHQVELYIPSKVTTDRSLSTPREIKKTTTYTRSRKKAKQVKFSEFRKKDPVLSTFKDLDEPVVPQRFCPKNEMHDVLDIKVEL